MIDDLVLEDVFSEEALTIAVPPDGPQRVLDARQLTPRAGGNPRRKVRRRSLIVAVVVTCAALPLAILGTQGGGGNRTAGRHNLPLSSQLRSAESQSAGAAAGVSGGSGTNVLNQSASASVPASAPAGASQPVSPNLVPDLPSRVIKTGTINLQVPAGEVGSVISELADQAQGFGGFVASSDTNTASAGQAPFGDITMRVPAGEFDQLIAKVKKDGNATSVSTAGQDVTAQYVDLQARIQSLDDARTQFQQILSRAQSIGDLLSVEQQISALQTQIEQLQGQLQVMDNQTQYSTLTAHVTESPKKAAPTKPAAPPSGISKAWIHARHSFAHGVEAVIGATGGIAVFLVFSGILAVAGRASWILLRRRWI